MNESLKNTYNTIVEVPEEHLLFFPGKGGSFEGGRMPIGSEKETGSIGAFMEVLYVGISCSVVIGSIDEYPGCF